MAQYDNSEWINDWRIVWRPLVPEDLGAVHHLLERIEDFDNPPYRTTTGEVRTWLSSPENWAGRIGVADGGPRDGKIVCFSQVTLVSGDESSCVCRSGVDPEYRHRGLGEHLVTWEVDTAKTLLKETSSRGTGKIFVNVDAGQSGMEEQLERHGFTRFRSTFELRRDLLSLPEIPELSHYQEIRPWDDDLDEQARKLFNRLRERGQGDHLQSREQWFAQRDFFVPEWSFAAVDVTGDRPNVVGFVMVSAYREDWEVLGWKEGYIDLMGVDGSASTTGVMQALLIHSMDAQRNDGMGRVATGIGSAENDGIQAFYGEMGFIRSFETHTFALDV